MRKRGLCCRPVSVSLYVMFVYCIQTAEDIVKLLSRPGSAIILVFFTASASTQFQGEPLQRGYTGWEIFFQFSTEITVLSPKQR